MTPTEFRELLTRAKKGDSDAMGELLLLYMPLINRYSIIDGRLDEDCRQHVIVQTITGIRKFEFQ